MKGVKVLRCRWYQAGKFVCLRCNEALQRGEGFRCWEVGEDGRRRYLHMKCGVPLQSDLTLPPFRNFWLIVENAVECVQGFRDSTLDSLTMTMAVRQLLLSASMAANDVSTHIVDLCNVEIGLGGLRWEERARAQLGFAKAVAQWAGSLIKWQDPYVRYEHEEDAYRKLVVGSALDLLVDFPGEYLA